MIINYCLCYKSISRHGSPVSRVCSSRLNMCDITTIISVWVETSQEMLKTMAMCLLSGAAAITARRMLLTLPPLPVYTIHWVSTAAAAPLCSASSLPAAGRAWPSCGGEAGTARYPHLHQALSNLLSRTHTTQEKSWYNSCVTSSHATTLPHPNQTFQWFVE